MANSSQLLPVPPGRDQQIMKIQEMLEQIALYTFTYGSELTDILAEPTTH